MKRDGHALYALRLKCRENLRRKMQACRRRGNRSDVLGVNRLVADTVFKLLLTRSFALYVGRHGSMAELIQQIHQRPLAQELDLPHSNPRQGLQQADLQFMIRTKDGNLPLAALPPASQHAVPDEFLRRLTLGSGRNHQDLDRTVRILPLANQPRRKDLRVIDDEQVVRRDVVDNVGDVAMLDDPRRTVQNHHAFRSTLLGGVLGNEPLRERIPKL